MVFLTVKKIASCSYESILYSLRWQSELGRLSAVDRVRPKADKPVKGALSARQGDARDIQRCLYGDHMSLPIEKTQLGRLSAHALLPNHETGRSGATYDHHRDSVGYHARPLDVRSAHP